MDATSFAGALVKMLLTAITFILSISPTSVPAPPAPVCVVMGMAERSCPTTQESEDGRTPFPTDGNICYYYDPGNPFASDVPGFPGWQKSNCYDEIFKDRACVPEQGKEIPARCEELKIPRY